MSLGKRGPDETQEPIRIEPSRLATPVIHPFYERLNELPNKREFDLFAESECKRSLLSRTADRVFRRDRFRARDRMADRRLDLHVQLHHGLPA